MTIRFDFEITVITHETQLGYIKIYCHMKPLLVATQKAGVVGGLYTKDELISTSTTVFTYTYITEYQCFNHGVVLYI